MPTPRWAVVAAVAATTATCCAASPLFTDAPIASDTPALSLDSMARGGVGSWLATGDAGWSVPATVPGDLVTDLQAAGVIADPMVDSRFLADPPVWDAAPVNVSCSFVVAEASGSVALLVLDSVKMAADVSLSGTGTSNSTTANAE